MAIHQKDGRYVILDGAFVNLVGLISIRTIDVDAETDDDGTTTARVCLVDIAESDAEQLCAEIMAAAAEIRAARES